MVSEDRERGIEELLTRGLLALEGELPEDGPDEATVARFLAAVQKASSDPDEVRRIEALAAEFGPSGSNAARSLAEHAMKQQRGSHNRTFVPRVLPAETPSLAGGAPMASPPFTLFVLSSHGGYAVPARRTELIFGRAESDVHVTVGKSDPYVSRKQGVLAGDGRNWALKNVGKLPIRVEDGALLLSGNEIMLPWGYTALFIGAPAHKSHLVEVYITGPESVLPYDVVPDNPTLSPDSYELSLEERLVMTVLAQRYLRQEPDPQPAPIRQLVEDLNRFSDRFSGRDEWSESRAQRVITSVRGRVTRRGRTSEPDMVAEGSADSMSDHNVIVVLLKTASIIPSDLEVLDTETE